MARGSCGVDAREEEEYLWDRVSSCCQSFRLLVIGRKTVSIVADDRCHGVEIACRHDLPNLIDLKFRSDAFGAAVEKYAR